MMSSEFLDELEEYIKAKKESIKRIEDKEDEDTEV